MPQLIGKFNKDIQGTLSGFDRLVFRGPGNLLLVVAAIDIFHGQVLLLNSSSAPFFTCWLTASLDVAFVIAGE